MIFGEFNIRLNDFPRVRKVNDIAKKLLEAYEADGTSSLIPPGGVNLALAHLLIEQQDSDTVNEVFTSSLRLDPRFFASVSFGQVHSSFASDRERDIRGEIQIKDEETGEVQDTKSFRIIVEE